MTYIASRRQKARKRHVCSGCCEPIEPGTVYNVTLSTDVRDFMAWKEHTLCGEILNTLGDSEDGFYEGDVWEYLKNVDLATVVEEWAHDYEAMVDVAFMWAKANG